MAIKPSPTIAGKLRKLFSNNKQTIESAIGDSIPGGSGGVKVFDTVVSDGILEIDAICSEIARALYFGQPCYVFLINSDTSGVKMGWIARTNFNDRTFMWTFNVISSDGEHLFSGYPDEKPKEVGLDC